MRLPFANGGYSGGDDEDAAPQTGHGVFGWKVDEQHAADDLETNPHPKKTAVDQSERRERDHFDRFRFFSRFG